MQPSSGIKTWQWVTTVIVIIVLIIIGVWVFGGKGAPSTTTTDTNVPTNSTPTTGAVNRVVMSDQYPGNVVYLSSVQLANPGWVVIQADNKGQPGEILGETYFGSGINPGKITLSKPMVDGSTYYAVLYDDTDGTQTFSATADKPLVDANGNVILQVFHASASAAAEIKG